MKRKSVVASFSGRQRLCRRGRILADRRRLGNRSPLSPAARLSISPLSAAADGGGGNQAASHRRRATMNSQPAIPARTSSPSATSIRTAALSSTLPKVTKYTLQMYDKQKTSGRHRQHSDRISRRAMAIQRGKHVYTESRSHTASGACRSACSPANTRSPPALGNRELPPA